MTLKSIHFTADLVIADMANSDYRTAAVFRKYGIDFCCGGRRTLFEACRILDLDPGLVVSDLNDAARNFSISNSLDFGSWNFDFLIDYILHVHHQYLILNLPETEDMLSIFVQGHRSKFTYLADLLDCFSKFKNEIILHLDHEEKIIFPYIRQIAHAYQSQEVYSALLVRTLRKPIEHLMNYEHEHVEGYLNRLRELTNNYTPPEPACVMHKVVFHKLKELDNDMIQHIHFENNVLFPKAIAMEKEILKST